MRIIKNFIDFIKILFYGIKLGPTELWRIDYYTNRETIKFVYKDNTLTKDQKDMIHMVLYIDGEACYPGSEHRSLLPDGLTLEDAKIVHSIHSDIFRKYDLNYILGTKPEYAYNCFKQELIQYSNLEELIKKYT